VDEAEATTSTMLTQVLQNHCRTSGGMSLPVHNVAIASALDLDRLVAECEDRPRAQTRPARFAALAPAHAVGPGSTATKIRRALVRSQYRQSLLIDTPANALHAGQFVSPVSAPPVPYRDILSMYDWRS
jgi:hypothetical protein